MEIRKIISVYEREEIENKIKLLMKKYYRDYYLIKLGLPDFKSRINNRLNETENASYYIDKVAKWINYKFDKTKKVLVVGAGTGAEFVQFSRRGCDAYAIEPNERAFEVLCLKAKLENISLGKCKKGIAEDLPFEDELFDFVYCFTVLEHVQNVEKGIKEMIRVTKKKNGFIFIVCPDYRQIWEGHYKLYLPLFMPKWFIKIILRIKGRPTHFLDSLQFVTAKQVRNVFREHNVIAMQVIHPYSREYFKAKGNVKIMKWIQDKLEIARDQFWIVKKDDTA